MLSVMEIGVPLVEGVPVASAPPAAMAIPAGWQTDFYMPDWTQEKRHRFEQLSREMEWDVASIKEAAHALAGANVVIIADDSGSMGQAVRNSPVPPPPGKFVTTRWDELINFLTLILKVGAELSHSVNFHFLNAGPVDDVHAWEQVEPIALRGPTDFTPLCGVMQRVFDRWDPAKTDRRLITVIATDGVPSDIPQGKNAAQAVGDILRDRPSIDRSFVTFLTCTDNDYDVAYIKELDSSVPNVDEVDDYYTEAAEVAKAGHKLYGHFSVGDWALRAVVGATIPAWDRSDEQQASAQGRARGRSDSASRSSGGGEGLFACCGSR